MLWRPFLSSLHIFSIWIAVSLEICVRSPKSIAFLWTVQCIFCSHILLAVSHAVDYSTKPFCFSTGVYFSAARSSWSLIFLDLHIACAILGRDIPSGVTNIFCTWHFFFSSYKFSSYSDEITYIC